MVNKSNSDIDNILNNLYIHKEIKEMIIKQIIDLILISESQGDLIDFYVINYKDFDQLLIDYQFNLKEGDYSSVLIYFKEDSPYRNPTLFYNKNNFYRISPKSNNIISCKDPSIEILKNNNFDIIPAIQHLRSLCIDSKVQFNKNSTEYISKQKEEYFSRDFNAIGKGYDTLRTDITKQLKTKEVIQFFINKSNNIAKEEINKNSKIDETELKNLLIKEIILKTKDNHKYNLIKEKGIENHFQKIKENLVETKIRKFEILDNINNLVSQLENMTAKAYQMTNLELLYIEKLSLENNYNFDDFLIKKVKINNKEFNQSFKARSTEKLVIDELILTEILHYIKKLFEKKIISFELSITLTRIYSKFIFLNKYIKSKK